MEPVITRRIRVYGIVQGVGFRPTVSRHARTAGVRGCVSNCGPYVEILAQGSPEQIRDFLSLLEGNPPRRAVILKMDVKEVPGDRVWDSFHIIESEKTKGEIFISPDIAICDECKAELYNPEDRRYLHPFINCTCCGPRMTILEELPYDRERTSMKMFSMCPSCRLEYETPATRRYDAQPVCCNDCGPVVYLLGRRERGREAITAARKVLLSGGIIAVKGIGGFHLCCDATNEAAVSLLRRRKHRPRKPFAVMMRDMDIVFRECEVVDGQEALLTGHQKPILLLRKRLGGHLAPSVAPENSTVGVMLPYAPVQLLLFDYDDGLCLPDCLVMTSGNQSGAPICRDDDEAERSLLPLSDAILSHNRKIRIRADDTVMDFYRGKPYMIRRSRGWAPLPFMLSGDWKGKVLAIGGELKNSFALTSGGLIYLSPYIGDLADLRTVEALKETVRRFETLLEIRPEAVACDLHPGYTSVAIAQELGLPVIGVQHHYAHILSCMAENDWQEPVIGLSFDGTGYGTDGTIWGGEVLLCGLTGFRRLGSIAPFIQAGGDAAAREGWRIAVSMVYGLLKEKEEASKVVERLGLCGPDAARVLFTMADRRINAVVSTSAGRLYDGASALLGICLAGTFEGDAATQLQYRAEGWLSAHPDGPGEEIILPRVGKDGFLTLETDGLIRRLIDGRLKGEDAGALAWRFHKDLAAQIAGAAVCAAGKTTIRTVALSGGTFQNRLLLDLTVKKLESRGFKVLTHSLTPPNDGGIALGQALAALGRLSGKAGDF